MVFNHLYTTRANTWDDVPLWETFELRTKCIFFLTTNKKKTICLSGMCGITT